MKQHIIQKQWDELSEEQQEFFVIKMGNNDGPYIIMPNIGQMIEFLGNGWAYDFMEEGTIYNELESDFASFCIKNEDLCDALWEAVKEKFKTQSPN